jgi:glycosyltransferase involved in cell wall biosynthesis
VAASRNLGIQRAQGEYIAFLDADDLFMQDNLMEKVKVLIEHPEVALVHGFEQTFLHATGENIAIIKGKDGLVLYDLLELRSTVIHSPSSVVCRKDVLLQLGGFDINMTTSADWDLWVRIAARSPIKNVNKILSRYRVHDHQMHLNIDKMRDDMKYAFRKCQRSALFKNERHYSLCYAQLCLILSLSYLGLKKDLFNFLKFLWLSLFSHPRPVALRVKKMFSPKFPVGNSPDHHG